MYQGSASRDFGLVVTCGTARTHKVGHAVEHLAHEDWKLVSKKFSARRYEITAVERPLPQTQERAPGKRALTSKRKSLGATKRRGYEQLNGAGKIRGTGSWHVGELLLWCQYGSTLGPRDQCLLVPARER